MSQARTDESVDTEHRPGSPEKQREHQMLNQDERTLVTSV